MLAARKKTRTTGSKKAGLTFPVARVRANLKKGKYSTRVGEGAPVYLTCILEYLAAEVLELAGNCARDFKTKRIKPRHMLLAIERDEELSILFKNRGLSGAGTMPWLHKSLMQKELAAAQKRERAQAKGADGKAAKPAKVAKAAATGAKATPAVPTAPPKLKAKSKAKELPTEAPEDAPADAPEAPTAPAAAEDPPAEGGAAESDDGADDNMFDDE